MTPELVLSTDLIQELARRAVKRLSSRHSVDVPYLLEARVSEQYERAVAMGTKAFLENLATRFKPDSAALAKVKTYLESEEVTGELAKLLDPGMEVFDSGALEQAFDEAMATLTPNPFEEGAASRAWSEFLKAFSFASRSSPDLREFLRASYEAGSFRALWNIHEISRRVDSDLDLLTGQERRLRDVVNAYLSDLLTYKKWAAETAVS